MTTIGWVLDHATSQRRLHIELRPSGLVQVTAEGYGQAPILVELDEDGVVILHGLLREALRRLEAQEEPPGP